MSVWLSKVGRDATAAMVPTEAMFWGSFMETGIRKRYAEIMQAEVIAPGVNRKGRPKSDDLKTQAVVEGFYLAIDGADDAAAPKPAGRSATSATENSQVDAKMVTVKRCCRTS
jgi:hypothetical protein